jgi:hypothetical protein
MATRKDFFEIYRPFEHAPSKSFASPGVGDTSYRLKAVQPKIRVSFPRTEKRVSSSPKRPHRSGAHTVSYPMGTRRYFPGDDWDWAWDWPLTPTSFRGYEWLELYRYSPIRLHGLHLYIFILNPLSIRAVHTYDLFILEVGHLDCQCAGLRSCAPFVLRS